MKTFSLLLALACFGCGTSARILSSDASKIVAYCHPDSWVKCLEVCQNGFVVVDDQGGFDTATLKCKP